MAKHIISKAIGIDLGTTNSVVALMNPTDTAIILHSENGRATTPSCIWKDRKTGQIIVGRKAFARIGTNPEPIRSIKRLMGKQTDELKQDKYMNMTPEEISSRILSEMKRQIEEDVAHLSTDSTEWIVDRAIITVPAYFDQPQIEATRKAGEMAGLQVLDLLRVYEIVVVKGKRIGYPL
jgi:molecular chaperone DnaK